MSDIQTNSNQSELPLLTFNSLYSLLREEKKSKTLQKLPELFYESLEKFFNDKKEEIKKFKDSENKDKLKKEKHVLSTSRKVALELIHMRNIKISDIAIKGEIYEDEDFSTENILEKEMEFYESVKKATQKSKKIVN